MKTPLHKISDPTAWNRVELSPDGWNRVVHVYLKSKELPGKIGADLVQGLRTAFSGLIAVAVKQSNSRLDQSIERRRRTVCYRADSDEISRAYLENDPMRRVRQGSSSHRSRRDEMIYAATTSFILNPGPRSVAGRSLCRFMILVSNQSNRTTFDATALICLIISMNGEDALAHSDKLE